MPSDVTGFLVPMLPTCIAEMDLCYFPTKIDNLLLILKSGIGYSATAGMGASVQMAAGNG